MPFSIFRTTSLSDTQRADLQSELQRKWNMLEMLYHDVTEVYVNGSREEARLAADLHHTLPQVQKYLQKRIERVRQSPEEALRVYQEKQVPAPRDRTQAACTAAARKAKDRGFSDIQVMYENIGSACARLWSSERHKDDTTSKAAQWFNPGERVRNMRDEQV